MSTDGIKYINSLKYADFDTNTLSSVGYIDEFKKVILNHPDTIKHFFENYKYFPGSCVENFLRLLWSSDKTNLALNHFDSLKEMVESRELSLSENAIRVFECISIDFPDTNLFFLSTLDIKNISNKEYALEVSVHNWNDADVLPDKFEGLKKFQILISLGSIAPKIEIRTVYGKYRQNGIFTWNLGDWQYVIKWKEMGD